MSRRLFGNVILGRHVKTFHPPLSHLLVKKEMIGTIKSTSKVRLNFHLETEDLINRQINFELGSSYFFLSLAAYCSRHGQNGPLGGLAERFRKESCRELGHAEKLINYQNLRGGRVVFSKVSAPEKFDESGIGLDAMQAAEQMETLVHQSLLQLHKAAEDENDVHLAYFLESNFLNEQVEILQDIKARISQMQSVADDGLNHIDDFIRH